MGVNGLPMWPDETRKPASRAFTIRHLDVCEGWLELDFYLHETPGLACQWAKNAEQDQAIGVLGPIGRPVRRGKQYLIGSDPTG